MEMTWQERFWNRVSIGSTCWVWTGPVDRDGYGQVQAPGTTRRAHRAAYELLRGEIPEGLTLDHLCRNKRCVNPDHLEPVTPQENIRRYVETVTHCKHGHPFDEENTYWRKNGGRDCRACTRRAQARYAARKASA